MRPTRHPDIMPSTRRHTDTARPCMLQQTPPCRDSFTSTTNHGHGQCRYTHVCQNVTYDMTADIIFPVPLPRGRKNDQNRVLKKKGARSETTTIRHIRVIPSRRLTGKNLTRPRPPKYNTAHLLRTRRRRNSMGEAKGHKRHLSR